MAAVKAAEGDDHQVVAFSVIGHKADAGFLALGPDWVRLRHLQTGLQAAGLEVISSYVSLTELSEYSAGMPEEHLQGAPVPAVAPRRQASDLLLPDEQTTRRQGQLVFARL